VIFTCQGVNLKRVNLKNFFFVIILIILSVFWYGFQKGKVNASEKTQIVTDLSGANLTGANLTGVSLDGVILCNTTMPDGEINNSGCKN
jgi:uncharacterized protein YjbI with pentapeptide repeats